MSSFRPGHSTAGLRVEGGWGLTHWIIDGLAIRGGNLGHSMTLDPDRSSSRGPFSRGMTRPKLVFHVSIICRLCRDLCCQNQTGSKRRVIQEWWKPLKPQSPIQDQQSRITNPGQGSKANRGRKRLGWTNSHSTFWDWRNRVRFGWRGQTGHKVVCTHLSSSRIDLTSGLCSVILSPIHSFKRLQKWGGNFLWSQSGTFCEIRDNLLGNLYNTIWTPVPLSASGKAKSKPV